MRRVPSRALSLTRPWPWAFLNERCPKRIENRSWPVPPRLIGEYIGLHAAKSWDEMGRELISQVAGLPCPPKSQHIHSVIFAVAKVLGCRPISEIGPSDDQSVWAFGPYCWIFTDVIPLRDPVKHAGGLSLWPIEPAARVKLLDQLNEVYRQNPQEASL